MVMAVHVRLVYYRRGTNQKKETMRVTDLDVKELVKFDSAAGEIRFAGERAILVDATAMGMMKKELVEQTSGPRPRDCSSPASASSRVGASPRRRRRSSTAESEAERSQRRRAFAHARGHVPDRAERPRRVVTEGGSTLIASFEAEQHIAHLGRSDSPTCWFICGLTSGYLSRVLDQEIFVLEDRCIGKGDPCAACSGARAKSGATSARRELRFFRREHLKDWLDVACTTSPARSRASRRSCA